MRLQLPGLQEAGLNEVFTGGLSSYSLGLMAIAHMKADPSADLGDLLIGFFHRFGTGSTTFDYATQAVSLRQVGLGLLLSSSCGTHCLSSLRGWGPPLLTCLAAVHSVYMRVAWWPTYVLQHWLWGSLTSDVLRQLYQKWGNMAARAMQFVGK